MIASLIKNLIGLVQIIFGTLLIGGGFALIKVIGAGTIVAMIFNILQLGAFSGIGLYLIYRGQENAQR